MAGSTVRLVMLLSALALLGGCVSTDTLYAEYDATLCGPTLVEAPEGLMVTDAEVSMPWVQAVYFEFDKAELDSNSMADLRRDVQVLLAFPDLNLSVRGFTDHLGSAYYNRALAWRRVNAVKDALLKLGIERRRLVMQPMGEALLLLPGDERKARAVNRRVELMLLDEAGRPIEMHLDEATFDAQ